ncbi:hypothetical protein DESC_90016 [Desulfosarcina cetonica]|nr:hypothetical protein DESC_90016 [Desulfosarcina cetonica]
MTKDTRNAGIGLFANPSKLKFFLEAHHAVDSPIIKVTYFDATDHPLAIRPPAPILAVMGLGDHFSRSESSFVASSGANRSAFLA